MMTGDNTSNENQRVCDIIRESEGEEKNKLLTNNLIIYLRYFDGLLMERILTDNYLSFKGNSERNVFNDFE